MSQDALSELTDPARLRVGINLANVLLVTGKSPKGDLQGIAPDMGALIAERLGVGVSYVPYATPGEVADGLDDDAWDIGLIAAEPKRAETIGFCQAYVQIEATYLVQPGSALQSIQEVDQPGVRIAVSERTAYDLYLSRTLQHGELVRIKGVNGAFEMFKADKLDALAGLVPALHDNAQALPGSRVLGGSYTSVRQAIGTKQENTHLKAFVEQFITDAKNSGLIAGLIEKHGVKGKLEVAAGA